MRNSLIIAAILAASSACASMNVSSHIERGINFERFASYNWGPADLLPVGDPRLDNNPFFRDYLTGAIEKRLHAKGFERALPGQQADLLIHYHASVNQKIDVYTADTQHGYCYGNCEPQFVDYEEGTLVIDLVDAGTNKVVWRGWAQDSMTGIIDHQDRLEAQVDEAVTKMMQRLPRGGAAAR
jgi:hypothetical protein